MDKKKKKKEQAIALLAQPKSGGRTYKGRNPLILKELELIRKENNGVINPHDVIEYAKNPNTSLHSCFEWDNTKAAKEYRLYQARSLIAVMVIVEPNTQKEVKAYVNVRKDDSEKRGYISTKEVKEHRSSILLDAFMELENFKRKYFFVQELKPIVRSIEEFLKENNEKMLKEKALYKGEKYA